MSAVGVVPALDFVVSATQVSTFELCPRKWAFRYIDGISSPPNKYAEMGLDTHGHLEDWLRLGKPPSGTDKSVALAQALIPYLPPPQAVDPRHVEIDQDYTLCGVRFNLKVDLFMPAVKVCAECAYPVFGASCVNGHSTICGERPRVYDHKTSGDLKWALSPEKLREDVQGSLYSGWALHKTGAPAVDLQWNYVRTKGAITTLPVGATVTGRDIEGRLGQSLETARKMRVIAESGVSAMQVPYDARGCAAYGGCPHQERCNLGPQDRMVSFTAQAVAATQGESKMSATEDFLAKLAQASGGGNNGQSNGQQPMQMVPQQQQPMQMVQQPMQMAPQQQQPMQMAPQQQPMQMAPQQQSMQMAPQQQQPMQLGPQMAPQQQPMQMAPQQQPMQMAPQQQPMQMAPQQQTVLGTATAPTEPARGRGRPSKPSADDPWVVFASATASVLVEKGFSFEQTASLAGQYADALVAEHAKRK